MNFTQLKPYWPIALLALAMFVAWAAWGMVVQQISPYTSPQVAIPLFYASLSLATMLTWATFAALLILVFWGRDTTITAATHVGLRQGVVIACAAMSLLVFQQFRLLTWLIMVLVVMMAMLIELFLRAK